MAHHHTLVIGRPAGRFLFGWWDAAAANFPLENEQPPFSRRLLWTWCQEGSPKPDGGVPLRRGWDTTWA